MIISNKGSEHQAGGWMGRMLTLRYREPEAALGREQMGLPMGI